VLLVTEMEGEGEKEGMDSYTMILHACITSMKGRKLRSGIFANEDLYKVKVEEVILQTYLEGPREKMIQADL